MKNNEKHYRLKGVNCPDCLLNIERNIKHIDGVENCSINIITKELKFSIAESYSEPDLEKQVFKKIHGCDHDVIIIDLDKPSFQRKTFQIEGINCPDCLQKLEKTISLIPGILNSTINIITKELKIEISDKENFQEVIEKVKNKIKEESDQNNHNKQNPNQKKKKLDNNTMLLIIGTFLFILGLAFNRYFEIKLFLFILSYALIGYKILYKAFRDIINLKLFDENFLIVIATLGAFFIGEFPEAVAVILLYKIGTFLENKAVNKSRSSIKALLEIKPDFANLKIGKNFEKVNPERVGLGDTILVKPGEKIPLDGEIISGNSFIDTKNITGESTPRKVVTGDKIYSGFINGNTPLTIRVEKSFSESTVSKIIELIQNAAANKSKTESFFTKFARIYTPAVVLIAVILAILPPLIFTECTFHEWIYRALIFLVVSCPCAMVISIPLTYFSGIGAASKYGILIKGSNYLEALTKAKAVVFDKTGTLTEGTFSVQEINPENFIQSDNLLKVAAYSEAYSNHPIADSIKLAYGKNIPTEKIKNYTELPGLGIKCDINEKSVLCGNSRLLLKNNIEFTNIEKPGCFIYIAIDNKFAGSLHISDEIKKDSPRTIQELNKLHINNTTILSGDNIAITKSIAEKLNIDNFHGELFPQGKLSKIEEIESSLKTNQNLIFIGDGVNDAPVIRRADIGVAMGGLGADAAIESADIVLMNDEPSLIPRAIKIANFTKKILYQNITLALGIKTVVLLLAVCGEANMWEAVFADVGVTVIAVLNSIRALHVKV